MNSHEPAHPKNLFHTLLRELMIARMRVDELEITA
jgi:hypothetical protein